MTTDHITVEDLRDDITQILEEPPTDDPTDTLRAIAELVGVDGYDYFERRGQWVLYPDGD